MVDKNDVRLRLSLERLRVSLRFRHSTRCYFIASTFLAMLLGGILLVSYASQGHVNRETYETPIGEERTVVLADGSSVHLRADTSMTATTSAGLTAVEIFRGRILIDVADDSPRELRVDVPGARIRDIGTQFEVATDGRESSVTVLEGSVEITKRRWFSDASIELTQGQQAHIDRDGQLFFVPPQRSSGAVESQAFRVFKGTALAEVAESFDRNNADLRFVIEGDARRIRVNATFSLNRPESLMGYLRDPKANVEVDVKGKIVRVRERAR